MTVACRAIVQPRFVLQRGPDAPVTPCACGCPFGLLRFAEAAPVLTCPDCGGALDLDLVQFHDLNPSKRRSPGHPPCPSMRRVIVPKVRDEVGREWAAKHGAERWDLFCVECGEKDGSVKKDELRGYRTTQKREDKNTYQRVEVLERAGMQCELCHRSDVPLDVGHCLSKHDADRLGIGPDVVESLWNKCAQCVVCNVDGFGKRSMEPDTYCKLGHTRTEAKKMINCGAKGPQRLDPVFYKVYLALRDAFLSRTGEAA